VSLEVLKLHPPVTVTLKGVIQLFLKSFMVIPSFIFISEFTCPFTLTPRVSDSDKLKGIHFSNLLDTISVIEEDTGVSHSFLIVVIVILHCVRATKKVT